MSKLYKKYKDVDLKKLQGDMLFVLSKVDELCRKHNIQYFAAGGTQLGAVRHKGYIPWDDDVDLGMLYDDYIRFISIPEEEYEGFGLYAPEKDPGDYYSFVSKFYYKDSRFISPIAKADGREDMGIFVEVFPFYPMVSNNHKINKVKTKANILKAFYTLACCENVVVFETGLSGFVKKTIKRILKLIIRLFRLTPEKIANKYDKVLCKYKGLEAEYVIMCADGFSMYKRTWVSETERVPFESITVPIPKGYKKYLKKAYGDDYMLIPPESQRWNQAAEYIRFIDGTEMK